MLMRSPGDLRNLSSLLSVLNKVTVRSILMLKRTLRRRSLKRMQSLIIDSINQTYFHRWTTEEKKKFYKFISNYDVTLNSEGKPNWQDVREKYQNYLGVQNLDKTINDIEKIVNKIKIKCVQVINPNSDYMDLENDELAELNISVEEAQRLNKNSNMLFFIRKSILSNNCQLFKSAVEELKKRNEELKKDDPAFMPGKYDPEKQDL